MTLSGGVSMPFDWSALVLVEKHRLHAARGVVVGAWTRRPNLLRSPRPGARVVDEPSRYLRRPPAARRWRHPPREALSPPRPRLGHRRAPRARAGPTRAPGAQLRSPTYPRR